MRCASVPSPVAGEATVIAFDTVVNTVALLFVVAAPLLVAVRIGLHRLAAAGGPRRP